MTGKGRAGRLGKRIGEIVATAIDNEIKDPRLEFVRPSTRSPTWRLPKRHWRPHAAVCGRWSASRPGSSSHRS